MSEIQVTRPTLAWSLGYRNVGRPITVSTDDASARGVVWSIEFRTGEVKLTVKTRVGLLFFRLQPDEVVHLDPEPAVSGRENER